MNIRHESLQQIKSIYTTCNKPKYYIQKGLLIQCNERSEHESFLQTIIIERKRRY
jgi:hypothetical protein